MTTWWLPEKVGSSPAVYLDAARKQTTDPNRAAKFKTRENCETWIKLWSVWTRGFVARDHGWYD